MVVTREQAIAFLQALNLAQPYVPPVIFVGIAGHPLLRSLEAVANGLIEFEPKTTAANAGATDRTGS
jgi:hypothetical protein